MRHQPARVEDLPRLNFQTDVIRKDRARFNQLTVGAWRGRELSVFLSPHGSYVQVDRQRWALELRTTPYGCRWFIRDKTGRTVTSLLMAPDGRVGSRHELGLKYRSEAGTRRRLAWARAKVIHKLEGVTPDVEWVRDHESYRPRKPKRMRTKVYDRLMGKLESKRVSAKALGASAATPVAHSASELSNL